MKKAIFALGVFTFMATNSNAQEPEQPKLRTVLEIVEVRPPQKLSVKHLKSGKANARFQVGEGTAAHEFDVALGRDTAPSISVEVVEIGDSFDYHYSVENGAAKQAINWVRTSRVIEEVETSEPAGVRRRFGLSWGFSREIGAGEKVNSLRATSRLSPGLMKMVVGVNLPAPLVPEESMSENLFAPGGPITDEYRFNSVLTLVPKLGSVDDIPGEIAEAAEEPEFSDIKSELEALQNADWVEIEKTLERVNKKASSSLARQWSFELLKFLRKRK